MKRNRSIYLIGFAMLFMALISFLSNAPPALAQGPVDEWTFNMLCAPGRCDGQQEIDEHLFVAPEGAVSVETEVWWIWTGHADQTPPQIQNNEHFRTSLGIDCPDLGNEETPPQLCGVTSFSQSDDLMVTVEHGDVGVCEGNACSSAGSVYANVIVRWSVEPPFGSVSATKIDEDGSPWNGVTVNLYKADGTFLASGLTPASFDDLKLGDYYIEEEVPAGSIPLSDTRFDFTLDEEHLNYEARFQNRCPRSIEATKVDEDDNPIKGWRIDLLQGDVVIDSDVTDGEGKVTFKDLDAGTYIVKEEQREGWKPLSPTSVDVTFGEDECTTKTVEFKNERPPCPRSIVATKEDQDGNPIEGWRIELWRDGQMIDDSSTDGEGQVTFTDLAPGTYTVKEEEREGWTPLTPTSVEVTFAENECVVKEVGFKNEGPDLACSDAVPVPASVPPEGAEVKVTITAKEAKTYCVDKVENGVQSNVAMGDTYELTIPNLKPGEYKAGVAAIENAPIGPDFKFFTPCEFRISVDRDLFCTLEKQADGVYMLGAEDDKGNPVDITAWKTVNNFNFPDYKPVFTEDDCRVDVDWPDKTGKEFKVDFWVEVAGNWYTSDACHLERERTTDSSQFQSYIGPVGLGDERPQLEAGKEYFDGPQSVMFNAEYPLEDGTCDVVLRHNGEEISDVTSSCFNEGTFHQIESVDGRATMTLESGVTKMIAYRNGVEQGQIFQTNDGPNSRWIHPLDQPFEHKPEFALELHGPPNTTDLLIYNTYETKVQYDQDGQAVVDLIYESPGMVAIYPIDSGDQIAGWTTVEAFEVGEPMTYAFAETGLYHYQIVDEHGGVLAGPTQDSAMELGAMPAMQCYAQLAYPAASLYVSLVDDMDIDCPDYWLMPIDPAHEAEHEFHIDYHRDANGDVVIEAMYLLNATTSVAQQYPYGRHDGVLPGLNLVGVPDVSMVAFCARPGYHEVAWWGGWENESYYIPERGYIVDEDTAKVWGPEQRADCIDAALRVNMELARQGLRTDHTYVHHGERSQGYQMMEQNIWSPYNLVSLRPPHIGTFLKTGTVLPYYNNPEDQLFWGWDLDKGGLADGIGEAELKQYMLSLGPVEYIDHTGIHPPEGFNP